MINWRQHEAITKLPKKFEQPKDLAEKFEQLEKFKQTIALPENFEQPKDLPEKFEQPDKFEQSRKILWSKPLQGLCS